MNETKSGTSRRDVLKLAGLAAPAAAVSVVAGAPAEAAADAAGEGLKKTAHVQKYLETARF